MAGDPVSILPWTALRRARGHLALLKKLVLERVSAVRRAMFIGVGPINQSKLHGSGMETSRHLHAAPTELGVLGDGSCYRHFAPKRRFQPAALGRVLNQSLSRGRAAAIKM
jgi:hypothetical protein